MLQGKWSLKHIHRLILLSNAYQQSSAENTAAMKVDSDNRLLWRMNRHRLEAEAVRDAVLSVSGKLNPAVGGAGYQDFLYVDRYAPIYSYVTPDKPELWRRTLYRFTVRSVPNPWLEPLDCPDASNFAPKRIATTTPLAALSLLNDPFMIQQADYFAKRLETEAGSDVAALVKLAYQLAFGRAPTADELISAQQLVTKLGLFQLCRALMNANEFIYVD